MNVSNADRSGFGMSRPDLSNFSRRWINSFGFFVAALLRLGLLARKLFNSGWFARYVGSFSSLGFFSRSVSIAGCASRNVSKFAIGYVAVVVAVVVVLVVWACTGGTAMPPAISKANTVVKTMRCCLDTRNIDNLRPLVTANPDPKKASAYHLNIEEVTVRSVPKSPVQARCIS